MPENVDLIHHDLGFVDAIMWGAATNWWGAPSVDVEFEPKDGVVGALFVETVSVFLDEAGDLCPGDWVNARVDAKAFVEFSLIDGLVPLANVSA